MKEKHRQSGGGELVEGSPLRSEPSTNSVAETEVSAHGRRRIFSAKYKLRILEEADRCGEPGEIGALLRREGLYSSHLSAWRKQRESGSLQGLKGKKRGRISKKSPLLEENRVLQQKIAKLERRLKKAETIIEFQKKLSALLDGSPESPEESDENAS